VRFIDNGDTITDTATGLEWTKADAPSRLSWQAGQDWCAGLRIGGHEDWRMPTIRELLTLVDYERCKPAADPALGLQSYDYWSSSTYQGSPGNAWVVYFFGGDTNADFKTLNGYVRGVRAGSRPFDHLDDAPVTRRELREALEGRGCEAVRQADAKRAAAEGALATLRDEVAYLKSQIAKARVALK